MRAHAKLLRVPCWLLVAIFGLLLAGCVSVPDSGPVREATRAEPEEDVQQPRFEPNGPSAGAEPADIVRGYLAAMRAYPADPGIVREFMTDEAASEWRPDRRVVVYTGSPRYRTSGRTVELGIDQLGALDDRGSWTSTRPAAAQRRLRLQLVQVDNEWRISKPPPGMVVSQDFFETRYEAYSLFFFDPTSSILVPDQIYVVDGDQTATLLVRGLVRGPTPWLAGAVESYVPASTDPTLSVPVDTDGIATVPLGPDVLSYGADQRRLLAAQLAWTLDQRLDIQGIRVTVDGVPVSLTDEAVEVLDTDFGSTYDPADAGASRNLFALQGKRIVTIADREAVPIAGIVGTGEIPVQSFGIDRTRQTVAAVKRGGTTAVVAPVSGGPSAVETWFDEGTALLRPQWDFFGRLWLADRLRGTSVFYTIQDGAWQAVRLPYEPLAPTRVTDFAVSRDGMRIAVIDGAGADSRLLLGRVTRPESGEEPVRVDRWRAIVTPTLPLSDFRDLAWATPTEIAVIARPTGQSHQPVTVDIDGSDVLTTTFVEFDARSIAATPTQDTPTVVGAADGRLYSQSNERWSAVVSDEDPNLHQPTYVE